MAHRGMEAHIGISGMFKHQTGKTGKYYALANLFWRNKGLGLTMVCPGE
ncbi:hypothetical protein AM1_2829 [Acaryochloris marina MBIC11017]|uniref:Uncharacterized protein n=1 Tax=Acaryochloris marina (strain MBIC 11017) TaxID=329726 RepID=B0CA94_ACAM1|nr:hypothetical protein AM1_2829 [Acaryochloris marina MBIC11017]